MQAVRGRDRGADMHQQCWREDRLPLRCAGEGEHRDRVDQGKGQECKGCTVQEVCVLEPTQVLFIPLLSNDRTASERRALHRPLHGRHILTP
jgi:hypothetical protein